MASQPNDRVGSVIRQLQDICSTISRYLQLRNDATRISGITLRLNTDLHK